VKGKPRKVSRTQWENGQGATQKMPAEEWKQATSNSWHGLCVWKEQATFWQKEYISIPPTVLCCCCRCPQGTVWLGCPTHSPMSFAELWLVTNWGNTKWAVIYNLKTLELRRLIQTRYEDGDSIWHGLFHKQDWEMNHFFDLLNDILKTRKICN
jgi:hypothetical protein